MLTKTHLKYGHIGGRKVYLILKEYCIFPKIEKSIINFLNKCDICQKSKHGNVRALGGMKPVLAERIGQLVSVDLIGELPTARFGMKYIFSIVDVFSKFVKLYPIRKATTKTLLHKLTTSYLQIIPNIETILSDHGTQFTSDLWYRTLNNLNIRTVHTSVYHPESNPVERINKEIGRIIRTYCHHKHTLWVDTLDFVENCLNNSVSGTTGEIPYGIMFGKPIKSFAESFVKFPEEKKFDYQSKLRLVRENLISKGEYRKRQHDKRLKPISYSIGDKVLVKEHKLSNQLEKQIKKFFLLYRGPYVVKEIKMNNAYVLKCVDSDQIVGTFNTTQLKKYFD